MQSTMNLLDSALRQQPAPYWTERLKLSRSALHTAKTRGHLSPAIAGALAEELGEPIDEWMVIAALESEKDSACKDRMLKRFQTAAGSVIKRCILHKPKTHQRRPLPAFLFLPLVPLGRLALDLILPRGTHDRCYA